jgi:hypothetical protein
MIEWIKERIEQAENNLKYAETESEKAYVHGQLYELKDILEALKSQ